LYGSFQVELFEYSPKNVSRISQLPLEKPLVIKKITLTEQQIYHESIPKFPQSTWSQATLTFTVVDVRENFFEYSQNPTSVFLGY